MVKSAYRWAPLLLFSAVRSDPKATAAGAQYAFFYSRYNPAPPQLVAWISRTHAAETPADLPACGKPRFRLRRLRLFA